ncbi:MAG: CD225/dispanin family protein [Candidatus Omnitrophica bacterium]|nr:CD225/dispanin family protein [Candidatus Omnitrophota bacterium]
MFCTKCGSPNDDNAWKCVKCGLALEHPVNQAQGSSVKVRNYLIPAILTTLCCCVPFGIVAIIYSAQVNSKIAASDADGAIASSRKAKIWCWVALITGIITTIIWVVIQTLGAAASVKK